MGKASAIADCKLSSKAGKTPCWACSGFGRVEYPGANSTVRVRVEVGVIFTSLSVVEEGEELGSSMRTARIVIIASIGKLLGTSVLTLTEALLPVISVLNDSTSNADGPETVSSISTWLVEVDILVMVSVVHVSELVAHAVVPPLTSAEHARTSTVEGVAPSVRSDQGAMKNVEIGWTRGGAV